MGYTTTGCWRSSGIPSVALAMPSLVPALCPCLAGRTCFGRKMRPWCGRSRCPISCRTSGSPWCPSGCRGLPTPRPHPWTTILVREVALLRPDVGVLNAPVRMAEMVHEAPIPLPRIVTRGVPAMPAVAIRRSATATPSVLLPEEDGIRRGTMRRRRPRLFRWPGSSTRWTFVTRSRRVDYFVGIPLLTRSWCPSNPGIHGIEDSGEERPSWRRHRCRCQLVVGVGR